MSLFPRCCCFRLLPTISKQQQLHLTHSRRFISIPDTNTITTKNNNNSQTKNATPWPSSEHAAFAFGRLASSKKEGISLDEFLNVIKEMKLDFNLSDVELKRVFRQLDTNGDGYLSLEEFKTGRRANSFTLALVEALSGKIETTCVSDDDVGVGLDDIDDIDETAKESSSKTTKTRTVFPPKDFDTKQSTSQYYQAPLSIGFVGEYTSIRRSRTLLDYNYHNNYTHERQLFQDSLIRSTVLLDGNRSERPWLVHTCGPMGSGKGWVLGWMSSNGILPLETVSKIDPDAFKSRMPEWSLYQQHHHQQGGGENEAGTLTHAESSYLSEIAEYVAMNNSMNVWIDGSLRNYEWYDTQFTMIRKRYPQYRIAILAIDAPDNVIRSRLEHREKETGRYVPPKLQRDSIRGLDVGVRKLTPKVDLIASISNESLFGSTLEPVLRFVSIIDASGNWDLIKSLNEETPFK